MSDAPHQERWKKDTDELYRAIGEFVVKFEHVCHALQIGVIFMLSKAGLSNQNVAQILLAGLTAEPLRTLFESLVAETQQLNTVEKGILKDVLNRIQRLTQERNDIVHSTWFIGWGNESSADFTDASGMKFHKDKNGAVVKSFAKKAADFERLSEEADQLAKVCLRLHACFVGGNKLERNFVVSKEGRVSVPPGT